MQWTDSAVTCTEIQAVQWTGAVDGKCSVLYWDTASLVDCSDRLAVHWTDSAVICNEIQAVHWTGSAVDWQCSVLYWETASLVDCSDRLALHWTVGRYMQCSLL